MHNFPPNINWRLPTLLATALGYVACGNFTALEQIAIGNWFLQIGQTILTNATYQEMIEKRIIGFEKINLNGESFKSGGSPFISQDTPDLKEFYEVFRNQITEAEIAKLHDAIKKINEELERIRKAK